MSNDDGQHIARELELIRQNAEMVGEAIRSVFEKSLTEPPPNRLNELIAELRSRELGKDKS